MSASMQPATSDHPELGAPTVLTFGSRFFYATLLPIGLLYAAGLAYLAYQFLNWKEPNYGPGSPGVMGIVLFFHAVWWIGFFAVLIGLCTFLAAFWPWRRRSTAFAGGLIVAAASAWFLGSMILPTAWEMLRVLG